jgi:glycosyltransferase involved in cell wall biosynthesis
MSSPRFSVIIPSYNRADFLPQAIDSVLAQGYQEFELIVVDDGSTDDTPAVLAARAGQFVHLRQENRGLAAARNAGLRVARGEFVGFLDSDDCWEPGFLAAVLATFEAHPDCGVVFVAERELSATGERRPRIHTKRSPGIFFTTEGLVGRDTGVGCGRPGVARRRWVAELGGFDESFRSAVDCEMWIRWSFRVRMVLLPEPLVLRRLHGGHLSGDRGKNARHWLTILERLAAQHPEFVRAHPRVWRRAVGKENLRLGRELLAAAGGNPEQVREARRALGRAVRHWPWFVRAWNYLFWSWVSPGTYARMRQAEQRLR